MLQDMPMVPEADPDLPGDLELGAFSVSLNVADLDVSRVFYEALGFAVSGGDAEHGYLIMKNGESTIGLFHGVFEGNILTFNPGLTNRMERIERTWMYARSSDGLSRRASAFRPTSILKQAQVARHMSLSVTRTETPFSSTSSSRSRMRHAERDWVSSYLTDLINLPEEQEHPE